MGVWVLSWSAVQQNVVSFVDFLGLEYHTSQDWQTAFSSSLLRIEQISIGIYEMLPAKQSRKQYCDPSSDEDSTCMSRRASTGHLRPSDTKTFSWKNWSDLGAQVLVATFFDVLHIVSHLVLGTNYCIRL